MSALTKYSETILKLSEFVKKLDECVRLEAFKFLLAEECKPAGYVPATSAPKTSSQRDPQSRTLAPQELIRKSGVSSFTEKAVVLAYWLEEFQQRPTFSSGDLKSAFEQAREKSPKNPSDLVAGLEATARMMKAEKSGGVQHYRLTSTAIQDVERWINAERTPHETE